MKTRFHPAWIVAGITFGTLFATAGFRSAPSVLILPLEDDFGWSRNVISTAVAINVLLYGLTAPFAAAFIAASAPAFTKPALSPDIAAASAVFAIAA